MEGTSLCFFKDETSFKDEKNFKIKIMLYEILIFRLKLFYRLY